MIVVTWSSEQYVYEEVEFRLWRMKSQVSYVYDEVEYLAKYACGEVDFQAWCGYNEMELKASCIDGDVEF